MTLDEFVSKWSGKVCDFDGHYSGQCVDLYRQYVKEVLGIPQTPPVAGAKDIWNNCPGFDKFPNTPDNIPLKGDVMIWGSKYGQYGHVAIVTEADINKFTCFSQNDPSGSLPGLKTYKAWSTLLGWLRAKEDITSDLQAQFDAQKITLADVERQRNELDTENKRKDGIISEITIQLQTANDTSKGYLSEIKTAKETLSTTFDCKPEWAEINAKATEAVGNADKLDELQRMKELEAKEYKATIDSLEKEIATLKSTTEASTAKILQLEGTIKELKYSSTTPIQAVPKKSILDIIKKLFGG